MQWPRLHLLFITANVAEAELGALEPRYYITLCILGLSLLCAVCCHSSRSILLNRLL